MRPGRCPRRPGRQRWRAKRPPRTPSCVQATAGHAPAPRNLGAAPTADGNEPFPRCVDAENGKGLPSYSGGRSPRDESGVIAGLVEVGFVDVRDGPTLR